MKTEKLVYSFHRKINYGNLGGETMKGISMFGCRENNLKNVDVVIPYSKIVCFIGVSGSGKSTLVFDTLYAEGKRRYIESLGVSEAYYMSKIKKPDADYFIGLPPAIALTQSGTNRNPRSSVGTISQASYYLQVLFSSCGIDTDNMHREMTPSMFNLNSPHGVCIECDGTGEILDFDELLIWPDQELSVAEGGLKLGGAKKGTTKYKFLDSFLKQYGCDVNTPIKCFSNELKVALLFGQKKNKKFKIEFPGIINDSEKIYKTTKSMDVRKDLERFMKRSVCSCCGGTGYNPDILDVKIGQKNIVSYMDMSIEELVNFWDNYSFLDDRDIIWNQIKKKFLKILHQCVDLGIGYLALSRKATTLSGGELQRLKIVSQISSEISGVVYVLDEPSVGLHASDIDKVLKAIRELHDVGNKNTIVLVEHTAKMIIAADYIYELGPGAGENGGEIIAKGTVEDVCHDSKSISGKYLEGICVAGEPNENFSYRLKDVIGLRHVTANNLRNISVDIPLGGMVCITGVSGSGKTSLIFDAFFQSMYYKRNIGLENIEGREKIKNIVLCDQSSIGKSSRSCPITYLDIYTSIRRLFAKEELAKKRKFKESLFSFNVDGGRCEKCKGEGVLKVNMGFLPEMEVICDVCGGKKFKENILEVKYKGLSIYEVLELSVVQAKDFFVNEKNIIIKLEAMEKVGLGYLKLGQSTSTLSGGESQRLKLAAEIAKTNAKGTLLIFDEPTKGLHFEDVKRLLNVMKELVKVGNTLWIIEHNLDIIASSDYVIDIGPGAGRFGGNIVGKGTPRELAQLNTPTGKELMKYYKRYSNFGTDIL